MPPTQTRYLTHRFTGGWAPAYGRLVSGLAMDGRAQESQSPIPYALEAKNIFWELDGGFRKIGGTTPIGSILSSGKTVMGVYDYWRIGTTGSYARRKIAHVGTTIKEDQGSDTWQNLFTDLEEGVHPNYATFADLLIISSDSNTDVPKSWDQTTAQSLAGSPPNFAFSVYHKNRMWAAGAVANPSRLYYTAADDPEDWVGAGSGFIDISPGDGDEIRGISGEYKNELWVFKGPNKGSIHRITGSTPSDFARVPFIEGLPCVGHSTIGRFRDDILFMTPSGSIRSLKATAAYGDYVDAAITFPINPWLLDNLNKSVLKKAWVVNDSTTSHLYVSVPTGSSTVNDTVLVYDHSFTSIEQPDRWSRITDWDAHSLATFTLQGLPRVMGGGSDGYVRNLNVSARSIDAVDPISAYVETPHLNYGTSIQEKTFTDVGVTLTPLGNHTMIFGWNRDTQFTNTATISQGDVGAELGDATAPTAEDFLLSDADAGGLDGSTMGGVNFNEVYHELTEGGAARWVQYTFSNTSLNEDLWLHAFTIGLQQGAFSTE